MPSTHVEPADVDPADRLSYGDGDPIQLCELCYPGSTVIGAVAHGYVAFRAGNGEHAGKVLVACEPLHSGDVIWAFDVDPTPDPCPDDLLDAAEADPETHEAELDERTDALTDWIHAVNTEVSFSKFVSPMSLSSVAALVDACADAGWDPLNGYVEMWIWDRIGQMLDAPAN